MDSDDELPEEPPPEYFQMRRRSNTLPKDFLSKLKVKQEQNADSTSGEDEPDNDDVIQGVELHKKLNKISIQNDENDRGQASPIGVKTGRKNGLNKVKILGETVNNNKRSNGTPRITVLPPLNNRGSNDERPSSTCSSTSERLSKKPALKNANVLLDELMKEATEEGLECTTRVRSPLPRGSNLYEKLLEDFGHDEEERDTLSPLPSPQARRKNRNVRNADILLPGDVTQSLPCTPPGRRKRVHWSQDTHFNKYK